MDYTTRPVWAEIDHECIRHNYREIRRFVKSGTAILGIVKADAYGHGAVEVSKTLISEGIDRLAVVMPEEAIELRANGINIPIHVTGEILHQQYPLIEMLQLTQSVGRRETLQGLSDYAELKKTVIPVHLVCDTGMGRLGPLPEETVEFVRHAYQLKGLRVEGLMTHLARGDEADGEYSRFQWKIFQEIIEMLRKEEIPIPLLHIANSPGLCLFPEMHLDIVRPGIILYGMLPSSSFIPSLSLKPALTWKAKIVNIKSLPAEHGVSYSSVYHTFQSEKIAVVPLGYEDGYFRSLSNTGEVLVHGKRAPVRGQMCMDQFMISVSHIPDVQVGDEVVLLGKQGEEEITAHELGLKAGTLNYDITCSISKRVPLRHMNYSDRVSTKNYIEE